MSSTRWLGLNLCSRSPEYGGLLAYDTVSATRAGIGRYVELFNNERPLKAPPRSDTSECSRGTPRQGCVKGDEIHDLTLPRPSPSFWWVLAAIGRFGRLGGSQTPQN